MLRQVVSIMTRGLLLKHIVKIHMKQHDIKEIKDVTSYTLRDDRPIWISLYKEMILDNNQWELIDGTSYNDLQSIICQLIGNLDETTLGATIAGDHSNDIGTEVTIPTVVCSCM